MINLVNGNNTIVLTLTEKTTLSFPIFLFRFVGKQNGVEYVCISSDISGFTYRYNEFIIKVKTSPNPLLGEINLTIGDEYDYYIYEQSSPTNLDYTLSTKLVEQGIMNYRVDNGERIEYERTNTTRAIYTR